MKHIMLIILINVLISIVAGCIAVNSDISSITIIFIWGIIVGIIDSVLLWKAYDKIEDEVE